MLHDYRKKYHDIERAFPLFILHVKYLATRELHSHTNFNTLSQKKNFVTKKTEAKLLVPLGAFVFTSRRKRELTGRVLLITPSPVFLKLMALNALSPKIKIKILICHPYLFTIEEVGEVDNLISSKYIFCDHVLNSHDHSVLQSIDITGRNLMLIALRA